MSDSDHDLVVIGCGMAGMSAARLALTNGRRVAALESLLYGGLITNVNELDGDVPGAGAEVAAVLMGELLDLGMEQLSAQATGIETEGNALVVTSDAGRHRARAVIVASGARQKRLGVPGEAELEFKGVSHCADCDGPMFTDQDVVVVGGGDSALQEALVLAAHCREVHLVHRSEAFRAQAHFVDAVGAHPKIRIHRPCRVDAVLGDESVSAVRVANVGDGAIWDIAASGFFAYVGLEPASEFVPEGVARDAAGLLVTDASMATSMPGVFAAGAVRAGYAGRLKDAIAEGEQAARSALPRLATANTVAV